MIEEAPVSSAAALVLAWFLGKHPKEEEDGHITWSDDPFLFTLYCVGIMVLVCVAGLMSGLTLALMSMDQVELEVLKRTGTAEEKRYASTIMPVIKNQNKLLVTLLLCNACASEALPLFLDRLADPLTAVLVSVSVVLVFGEVLPQAVCSRYGLLVGAYSSWFVSLLMTLTMPISLPIAKLLDVVLGPHHSALFRRAELKALVDVHADTAGFGGTLTAEEIHVIRGALDLTGKTATKSMTPLDKVFMLSTEDRLDERCKQAVLLSGHSRIPVYQRGNRRDIVGVILAKELVLINPADNVSVRELRTRPLPHLSADTPMYDMLRIFRTGKSHVALLTMPWTAADAKLQRSPSVGRASHTRAAPRMGTRGHQRTDSSGQPSKQPIGIITMEDVIEELLQEEIVDETDMYVDNLQTNRVGGANTGSLPPRLRIMLNAGAFTPRIGRLGCPAQVPLSYAHEAGNLDEQLLLLDAQALSQEIRSMSATGARSIGPRAMARGTPPAEGAPMARVSRGTPPTESSLMEEGRRANTVE
ncbi:hypothetical protein FOA52_003141 [Chlamydomonas sp. UWO 241]|nr:hypothetical protein FOA52_003141 [Chlamydomonas sp. UWO 241]